MMESSHALLARERKARAYSNHLRKHDITAQEMELFAQQRPEECAAFWQKLAVTLKLNPPSEKTVKLICDMLRESQ